MIELPYRTGLWLLATAALLLGAGHVHAQVIGAPEPPEVTWTQRLGESVPLDTAFRDAAGREVRLADSFGERPVLLALVYYECPMLCNLVLEGLVRSLRAVPFDPGEGYEIVVLSIDPGETTEQAAQARATYVESLGRSGTGWTFLTGDEAAIQRVADAVGFGFTYVPATDEYAHAAGITVLSPEGIVSRVLFGVDFAPRDVRLALVEASEGKLGTVVDRVLLRCFSYDPSRGKYGVAILSSIRIAGLLTVAILCFFLVRMLRNDRRARVLAAKEAMS